MRKKKLRRIIKDQQRIIETFTELTSKDCQVSVREMFRVFTYEDGSQATAAFVAKKCEKPVSSPPPEVPKHRANNGN